MHEKNTYCLEIKNLKITENQISSNFVLNTKRQKSFEFHVSEFVKVL